MMLAAWPFRNKSAVATVSSDRYRVHYQSSRYVVFSEYEGIYVAGRGVPGKVLVGDFLGGPLGAAVSGDEKWVVSVGYGFTAYRLGPPWRPYGHNPRSQSWWECKWVRQLRPGERILLPTMSADGDTLVLSNVSAVPRTHKFVLTGACGPVSNWVAREYVLDVDTRELHLTRQWVEEGVKRSDEMRHPLEGM